MYNSPIYLYETAVQSIMEERENAIFAKIQSSLDVDVDKDELIRALQYDRGQYDKGYRDGKADATPKWIPVSERSPEPWKWILCYCEVGFIEMLRYDDFMDEWDSVNINKAYKKDYVTHWMPLPEPPEEVE